MAWPDALLVAGSAGADGVGGNGATSRIGTLANHWRGRSGSNGGAAQVGGGGGGGGAAAGIDIRVENPRRITVGASGGGGGAGGCAGAAGGGGASGGGSFAVFIVFDQLNPTSLDDFLCWKTTNCGGLGGRGGSGGKGGGGGEGGLGGLGGPTGNNVDYEFCSLLVKVGGMVVMRRRRSRRK